MTTILTPPKVDAQEKKFTGSLTSTLVGTLLILSFIPLAFMAVVAYVRARALLREQAITQSENLLANQLKIIDREIKNKESQLERQVTADEFSVIIELALHANPQSDQFREVRNNFLNEFNSNNLQNNQPTFDQFFLLGPDDRIKVSSNAEWQNQEINPEIFGQESEFHSLALYGLAPIYQDEFILVTAIDYKTERGSVVGTVVGITENQSLQELIQPLNGLAPFANTYFMLSDSQFVSSNAETGEFKLIDASSVSQEELAGRLMAMMEGDNQSPEALEITAPNGEPALAQLQWFPRMKSGIVLEVNANDIYGRVTSLAPFTFFLVLGTLIATAFVLRFGIRRVIRPLQSLSVITRKFADGDWSQRAQLLSNDEIGLLGSSFNYMANELGELYSSLEQKVDERTRQIQTAAEVAQSITTTSMNLDEMLDKTVELLVQRFGFYQASIFLVDHGGQYIDFKTGFGLATKALTEHKYRLAVGSESIIGWVSANNLPRVASDVLEDPLHLKYELLPETRSEASVPISIGKLVLGVLDVQSTQANSFSKDAIIMLQTLASQIATAIQTSGLVEASHINLEELERLYRSSRKIAEAKTENDIINASIKILEEVPHHVTLFRVENKLVKRTILADTAGTASLGETQSRMGVNITELDNYLLRGPVITTPEENATPAIFRDATNLLHLNSVAYLPIRKHDTLVAVIMLGSRNRIFSNTIIQPYKNLSDLISVSLEKSEALQQTEKHLHEMESLASVSDLISSTSDIQSFFHALLAKIKEIIGDYNLIVALYDEKTNSISIPFSYENGKIISIEPFPIGEGLTSILLRTREPLMLVEDTERKAAELGAKIAGQPARSWMGAPMLVQNKPIGALIIQDLENEQAFDEDDLKFFTTVAGQVAGVINNIHLLDESQQKALQLETAAEIARDISSSLNLDELLIKAVNFIRERFNFYHSSIFLQDLTREFSVIREATGDAGAQMKKIGYKIGVGSKSIVGFVSGKGEPLIVNDITKDATYYPNPLLPETRSEAAIPLKVGERILGVLDVQSTKPYAFSEDNLRSLQILADQLAVAVVNTELFSETQEHLSQHRLLHHITTSAASGTTLEEALESAVSGLQVTLGGDRVAILLTDRDKKKLEVKASTGYAEEISKMQIEIGSGITGWVAAHRRPLRVKDVDEEPRYVPASPNTRSEMAIPLIYRNELLGVLNVESEQVDAYTENDEEMLGTLGGSLAAIIANARLLEQIRIQVENEHLINDVANKIRRSTDVQSILMTTASEITRITGAQFTKIKVKPVHSPDKEDLS